NGMLSSSPFSLRSFFFYSQLPFKFNHHSFTTKPIFNNYKVLPNHQLLCYLHASCSTDKTSLCFFFVQFLCVNLSFAAFSNTALNYAHSDDELPEKENDRDDANASGIGFLHLMEQRGVRANSQTFLWLLEGCLNSGSSFTDGVKLHGKILKMGFCDEVVLCERIMDFYLAFGDLNGAVKVFDEMPVRTLSCWNKIFHRFVEERVTGSIPGLFRRMMKENVKLDEKTLAVVL
ncbi:hypothetical protein KIW84_012383, partial [Lathyrus oleraceus]